MRTQSGRPNDAQSRTTKPCGRSARRKRAPSQTWTSTKLAIDGSTWTRVCDEGSRFVDVRFGRGLQSCQAGPQGAGVDAPGWPYSVHRARHLGRREKIAKAQAGQRLILGHRAQDDQVAELQERLAAPAVVDEWRVGFVEHQQPIGVLPEQLLDLSWPAVVAGGIVRVTHEQCPHGSGITGVGDLDGRRADDARGTGVFAKRRPDDADPVASAQRGECDEPHQLGRAIAQHHLLG